MACTIALSGAPRSSASSAPVWPGSSSVGTLRASPDASFPIAPRDCTVERAGGSTHPWDAAHRPRPVPPSRRRARRATDDVHARGSPSASARGAGLRLPLRHRLVGLRRPLGRCAVAAPARRGWCAPQASYLRFVSDEVPYDDSLELRQALLSDVMLASRWTGSRWSAPTAARRSSSPDVRLQVGQVGDRDRADGDYEPGYWEQRGYDKTPGSATPTRSQRQESIRRPPSADVVPRFHRHRANAPLGARGCVLRAARDRADALPPELSEASRGGISSRTSTSGSPSAGRSRSCSPSRSETGALRARLARGRDDRRRRPSLADGARRHKAGSTRVRS